MTPQTTPVEIIPSIFADFTDYKNRTLKIDEADAFVKANPGWQKYALRKTDPATGVALVRFAVRPIGAKISDGREASAFEPVETTKQIMDRLRPTLEVQTVQNGVKHPRSTSLAYKVWKVLDDTYASQPADQPLSKATITRLAAERDWNLGNVMTECSLWRRFHGITWKVSK